VPGRFPVKLEVEARDKDLFLAAGAAAPVRSTLNTRRQSTSCACVILRIGTITDILVLKLH